VELLAVRIRGSTEWLGNCSDETASSHCLPQRLKLRDLGIHLQQGFAPREMGFRAASHEIKDRNRMSALGGGFNRSTLADS
jgi:hypothetical protein